MCSVHLGELGGSVVNPQAWWIYCTFTRML
jgi:hypothetical protein